MKTTAEGNKAPLCSREDDIQHPGIRGMEEYGEKNVAVHDRALGCAARGW